MEDDAVKLIINSLQSIDNKLGKHDERIDKLVDSFQKLVEVEIRTKEIEFSVGRVYDRLEAVEDNQTTDGCPVHQRLVAVRAEQMKSIDEKIVHLEDLSTKIDDRLKDIEGKPIKRMEVAIYEIIKYVTIGVLGLIAYKFGFSK